MGFIGQIHETKHQEIFDKAFIALQSRGTHASGIAAVFEDDSFTALKHCIPAKEFVTLKEYRDIMLMQPKVVIAHTRYKTHGSEENNENNHPFWSENGEWFIVHNGIISTTYSEIKNKLTSECDSEQILRLIELYGIHKAMNELNINSNGFSILAINTKLKRLYHAKSLKRDLVIKRTLINGKLSLFFCSTDKIAQQGFVDSGIQCGLNNFIDTDDEYLYTFDYEGHELSKQLIKHQTKSTSKYYDFTSPYYRRKYNNVDVIEL